LKQAGVPRKEAKGLGIVIDHRRNRRSEESEKVNVERLKEYRSRLIVFPKKAGKAKKGDSSVSHRRFGERWLAWGARLLKAPILEL
jgi:large subunit ribosomal protein L13e